MIKDSSGTYVANYEGCKYEATNITVVVGDRVSSDWRPVGVADPNYGDSIGTPSDNNGGNEGGSEGGNEGGGNEGVMVIMAVMKAAVETVSIHKF
ncbi:hypothetical protein AB6G19_09995 [Providencia manganoxydans]